MHELLPFVLTGLISGMIYGLAGTGLTLTFKTSGILNFGHGAILTAAAMLYYAFRVTIGWPWPVAVILAVGVAGPGLGLVMELLARNIARQRTALKVVGTIGLTVLVPALCLIFYPRSNDTLKVARFLPLSNRARYRYRIVGVNIFGDQIVTAIVAVVATTLLYLLFRLTRLGGEMRAAVDDPDLLDLTGTSPTRVRRIAWVLGCTFAALSGVLILPLVGLQPYNLTFLAMYAFGATAIGAFSNIPLTFVGGLAIGIAKDVIGHIVSKHRWDGLTGLPDALPFVVLFIVLIALPKDRLASRSEAEERPSLPWRGPLELRMGVGIVVLALLALVPRFAGHNLSYFSLGLAQATLMLSLGLLIRTSGMMSLCHATFAAIGAAVFSQLATQTHLPWLVCLLLAALVVVPVGALVALPAIRLQGVYLALATFGFGLLVQRLVFPQAWMFFTFAGGRRIPAPFGSTDAHTRYFTILIGFVLVALAIVAISESRLGRILRGIGDAPTAVSTLGLSMNVTKVIVFCMSAFLAAIAGVMFGVQLTSVDGSTQYFQPFYSLVLVAILTLAPFREPWYAVFAGMTAVIPAFFHGARSPNVLNAGFGLFAILIATQGGQRSMSPKLRTVFDRFGRQRSRVRPTLATTAPVATKAMATTAKAAGLEVRELSVRFGGLRAVDSVSLAAPVGRITGLIGPNGAGKTTTFNACSGINRRVNGTITFNGVDLASKSAPQRGRMGIGRTFQRTELCDGLTVFENVALGSESPLAGARPDRQLAAPPSERRATLDATHRAIELCGIGRLADQQAGALSTGQRRLVELARGLAGNFALLLLDEPSSGLDREETAQFGELLGRVVADRGCGVLLVEHDMSLVMSICSYIYVLDFGRAIFEGTPAEVASSPIVRAAYLGSEADELTAVTGDLDGELA